MDRREALLAMIGGANLFAADPPPRRLSQAEVEKLLENPKNLFFLDVREPAEIQQLGSIKGYVNVPLGQLEARLAEIPRNKLIVTL